MIVLSAGMQKSGTGWYYNLTNDLLIAAGFPDARVVRTRYRLEGVLNHSNCSLNSTSLRALLRVALPHFLGKSFVIKTHLPPSRRVRQLIDLGVMRCTYIYRDPRDVVISALDHGKKLRESGNTGTFGRLVTLEDSVRFVTQLLQSWEAWMQTPRTLLVRYEDLQRDTPGELQRLKDFLKIKLPAQELAGIAARYQAAGLEDEQVKGSLHFNQGVAGRFRDVLSPGDLELCNLRFGSYLQRMGYAI